MYVHDLDVDLLRRTLDAQRAMLAQEDKLDARFARWMAEGPDKGGAIAQRNMQRKLDRLTWAADDLLYDRQVIALVQGVLGEPDWYPHPNPEEMIETLERAIVAAEPIVATWRAIVDGASS